MAELDGTVEETLEDFNGTTYTETEFAFRDFPAHEVAVNALMVGLAAGGGPGGVPDAEDVDFTPAGTISATDVQAALKELDADIQGISATEAALTWNAVSWENGWDDYGSGYGDVEYAKDAAKGLLYFRGVANPNGSNTAFTLPAGFRPAATRILNILNGTGIGAADVTTGGAVTFFLLPNDTTAIFDGKVISL